MKGEEGGRGGAAPQRGLGWGGAARGRFGAFGGLFGAAEQRCSNGSNTDPNRDALDPKLTKKSSIWAFLTPNPSETPIWAFLTPNPSQRPQFGPS